MGEEGKGVPESSYRPYERGPRRCTGSELANLEGRVVVACVGRWFEFVKVGLGEKELDEEGKGVLDEGGKWKTRGKMFSVSSWWFCFPFFWCCYFVDVGTNVWTDVSGYV